ncbi:hypothetical protein DSCW_53520 [Desulfosarcina widdelii]|uniref:Uncharacterized protein n=1 Tax=Desulfosarcina widdelii TaxID=947919 RepID=A0A5K7ZB20_9BACT|nr:hypothetical protein DSCW_53520 [Desulfosarcina widdelii]
MKSIACDSRMQFVESDSAIDNLGARFRKTRPGPELDLVESFLQAMPLSIPNGCRATVFREPQLESGFPDLVIVVWREEITHDWRSERGSLMSCDLRLMHFLHHSKRAREDKLVAYFGKRAAGSIGRLHNAGMIWPVGSAWAPFALRRSFAATKIIAVEAKVGKWASVLNQALLNTWFASKSYVLVPRLPSQRQLVDAKRHGIGVCSFDRGKVREVNSVSTRLPRSYASWMLNDWAWRSAQA